MRKGVMRIEFQLAASCLTICGDIQQTIKSTDKRRRN